MTGLRKAALVTICLLVTASATASFCESYRGLFLWAEHHGLSGIWAAGFPLQIDVFIGVGELALFVALADRWAVRSRVAAWGVTVLGLAASVAGNVGHIAGTDTASRITAAVPPLAAAAALTVGLGVLKRVVASKVTPGPAHMPGTFLVTAGNHEALPASDLPIGSATSPTTAALNGHGHQAAELFAAELAEGNVPTIRRIRSQMHVGQPRAQQVRQYLADLTRTP